MAGPVVFDLTTAAALNIMGEAATYHRSGQADAAVHVVFEDSYVEVVTDLGTRLSSTGPRAFVRLADLDPPPVVGDEMTVRGERLRVRDVQPDDAGAAKLVLEAI